MKVRQCYGNVVRDLDVNRREGPTSKSAPARRAGSLMYLQAKCELDLSDKIKRCSETL